MSVDNPLAFPVSTIDGFTQHGMTLRDWLVGQALVGLLASGAFSNSGDGFEDFIAVRASNIADALLAARQQEK